jgi:hypothetical protein
MIPIPDPLFFIRGALYSFLHTISKKSAFQSPCEKYWAIKHVVNRINDKEQLSPDTYGPIGILSCGTVHCPSCADPLYTGGYIKKYRGEIVEIFCYEYY